MRFIDLHSHILPGVDDGARTLTDTIEMLRLAVADGTVRIAATPHMFHPGFGNTDLDVIRHRFEETKTALASRGQQEGFEFLKAIELELGAENFLSPEFLEALSTHDVLTMAGGRYILVEPPWSLPWTPMKSVLERILSLDLVPILAHVERYGVFRNSAELLDRVLDMGCLTQVNASALSGRWLSLERRFVSGLFKHGRVSILASDGHNASNRPPRVGSGAAFLQRQFGEDRVRRWSFDSPAWVLGDQGSAPSAPTAGRGDNV